MSEEQIIEKISEYIKNECKNDVTAHDWWHINRVLNNALNINKEENANEFIVTLIALLHDLYDHKFFKGDIQEKLKETLKELKVYEYIKSDDIKNIVYSCENLGFYSNIDGKKELSKEGQIVQDADRLDALGAIAIARVFAYGGKMGVPIHDPKKGIATDKEEYKKSGSITSIAHFYDKLLRVKENMNTNVAKKISVKRHEFIEKYLEEFFAEWNGEK